MKADALESVRREVYRRFPDFRGVAPQVKSQAPVHGQPAFLLTFRQQAKVAGGQELPRWVRVVAGEDGRIIKITTSR